MRAAGDHETELDVIRRTEYGAEASAVVAAGTAHRAAFQSSDVVSVQRTATAGMR